MDSRNESNDFTITLINNSLKELYEEWKSEGLSDDEILLRVTICMINLLMTEHTVLNLLLEMNVCGTEAFLRLKRCI